MEQLRALIEWTLQLVVEMPTTWDAVSTMWRAMETETDEGSRMDLFIELEFAEELLICFVEPVQE